MNEIGSEKIKSDQNKPDRLKQKQTGSAIVRTTPFGLLYFTNFAVKM